eukprot:1311126-Rhodomonas_salina.3
MEILETEMPAGVMFPEEVAAPCCPTQLDLSVDLVGHGCLPKSIPESHSSSTFCTRNAVRFCASRFCGVSQLAVFTWTMLLVVFAMRCAALGAEIG